MKKEDYESQAKQLLLQGYAPVAQVKELALKLEKADKFDKIKDSLYPSTRKLISDEVDEIHPTPLKERINRTVFRLKLVQRKLEDSRLRSEQKYKKLFNKYVQAQRAKDQMVAVMYANENAQIRTIAKTLISAQLAVEQVVLRLETVKDVSDIAEIMSAAETIRAVKGRLKGIIPEVSMQLGFITHFLDSLVLEAVEVTGTSVSAIASNEEAERILLEATTIAEQKIRVGFPELLTTREVAALKLISDEVKE